VFIGAMNFPGRSVAKEIHRISEDGFDFVDLTLEPPAAWLPDARDIGRLMKDLGVFAVGHTAWYLPIASPFPELRETAHDLFKRGLDAFQEAGVKLVNIHPDQKVPLHSIEQVRDMNVEAIGRLSKEAQLRGIRLMVENLDRLFSSVDDLKSIFDGVADAGFHLDIGHANLNTGLRGTNRTKELLEAFGDRLSHVHVSDNRGGADDLHLPLGAGMVDWRFAIRTLKAVGYDGTVTLEVFSREREHLRTSRSLWLKWWGEY
jgi:sugar phosphate isomerase/epimerase